MSRTDRKGFTLIELLTVIAIIAVLSALLLPVFATAREQARTTQCMSQMHQLWVSANVYRQDEGSFPPALFGLAERDTPRADGTRFIVDPAGVDKDQVLGTKNGAYLVKVAMNRVVNGYMYGQQVRDASTYVCPDTAGAKGGPVPQNMVDVIAYPPRPSNWDPKYSWIGEKLAAAGCPVFYGATFDCWTSGPYKGMYKWYYMADSYDLGQRPGLITQYPTLSFKNYNTDWTGSRGSADMPQQLKYNNPPTDRTLFTFCTWHWTVYNSSTAPAINMAGSAKKLPVADLMKYAGQLYSHL